MRRLPLLALAAALACTSEVSPQNPYDPATPLPLQAKARVSGSVETGLGAPVAGLTVFLRQNGQPVRTFTTDGAGAFVFDSLTPGAYAVEAQAPGFALVSVPLSLSAGAEVDVGALSLTPIGGASTGSLRGSAVLGRMTALVGGPVEADPAADNTGIHVEAVGTPFAAVTTSTGDYELALPPGVHTLRVSHPNYVAQTLPDLQVSLGVVSPVVVVVLAANPATVSGQVVAELPDGSAGPLADAVVTLEGTSATGFTNAAGQFTLDQLAPGSYQLRVLKAGYQTASAPVLNLTGGEERTLADPVSLVLQRGALRGTVMLADMPGDATGAVVEVTGSGRAAVTGADGAFAFDALVTGTYEVRVRRDGYGLQVVGGLAVVAGATVTVPPVTLTRQGGTVAITEGPVTRLRPITLLLGAPSAAGFRASEDPTFTDPALGDVASAPARPYAGPGSSHPFTLSDRDGSHDVSVVFIDGSGSPSAPASASIVLDRVAPLDPSVVVETGAASTRHTTVGLALSAADLPATPGAAVSGLSKMELADNSLFTGSVVLDYNLAHTWTFTGGDGLKAVYARFHDRAGNVSAADVALVTLDTLAPQSPSLALSGADGAPAGTTGSPLVTAILSATDANEGTGKQDLQMRLSNASGFAGAAWQPFAASASWLLPPGDGPKTVFAQFMDPAGNQSLPVQASIALAGTAPGAGSISLAGGAAATSAQVVPVALSATGAAQMRLHVNGVEATGWIPYAASTTVDLGALPDEAVRVVSVTFRNSAGVEGGAASASIILDQRGPTAPSLAVNGGAAFTGSPTVTLSLAATDAPAAAGGFSAGLDTVELAGDGSFSGATVLPYATSVPWTFTVGDGTRSVWARFRDRAGNLSAAVSASVVLDATGPAAPAIALSGNPEAQAGYTGTAVVTATLSATDANEGAGKANLEVRLSNDSGFAGASWQPYATGLPWVLPSGDGAKTVHAQFRDAAGNLSLVASASITLDATPPTGGAIAVAAGAASTNQGSVPAVITATGAAQMQLYVNGEAQPGGWQPYATGATVTLGATPDETTRTVSVVFRSFGGVEGGAAVTSILMDRTAPRSPSVQVAAGAAFTGGTAVTLTLSASDGPTTGTSASGLDTVEVANDAGFTGASTFPYAASLPWTLSAGADGTRTVHVRFRDKAGNVSAPASDGLALDTLGPTAPSIALAGNLTAQAGYTGTPVVTATLSATDPNEGAGKANLQVRVSNDVGFSGASWQPYATSLPWVLPIGDGARTVYAQFRDAVGNLSLPVNASITLAEAPPSAGTIALAGGAPATNQPSVTATLGATGATRMQLYVDGVAQPGGFVPYATSAPVDLGLSPDESTRTVSVVFRSAGGVDGGDALATIVMDRVAPTSPGVLVNAGAAYTSPAAVTLSVSALDGPAIGGVASGLASVEVANDAAFTGSTLFAMADAVPWTLPAGDGSKTVHARFRDKAGNVSAPTSDGIVRDTAGPTAPTIGLVGDPLASAGYTGTPVVTATLSATDVNEGSGGANLQVRVANEVGFSGVSWQPYTTSLPWLLPTGDGTKTVYAQFRDAAGNVSATASATIQLLTTPPSGGSIVLASGAAATSLRVIPVAISAGNAASMRLSVNGVAVTDWVAYATSTTVDLGANPDQATRVVTVSFRNLGGVEGGAATAAIRFDQTAPMAGALAVSGTLGNGTVSAVLTATPAVVLQITPPGGDETEMAVTQAATALTPCPASFGSPLWQPVSRSATLVLTGADGAKRACVLFRDAAGNFAVASATGATITLDTTPPTNPELVNVASRTQNAATAPAAGLPQVTAATDATAGGVTYQCVGGVSPSFGPQWGDCGAGTTLPSAWTLAPNQESTLGVRARDAAYNYSPGSFARIVHDGVAPFPPFVTDLRASRDSVTVTWDATADTDVVSYLVHYGNSVADYAGSGAAQGPSPVLVSAVGGQVAPSLTLTNLVPGLPYYVAVEAVDAAGNRSGPGGQRLAVPNKANPRVLSTFGGQPRSAGSAVAGAKTFLYLAQNQGIVQLDVTSDAGLPAVVGRAYLPDLVPDQGQSLAVITCSKGGVTGHCVLPTGTTAEGDFRGDATTYRASAPIVFFKTTGTNAAPTVGTIEGLLPVQPTHVLVGTFGLEQVVVTVDRGGVRAFTFKAGQLAFVRQVARADFSASVLQVYAATLVGAQVHAYARVDPRDDSAPNLWTFDLTGVLAGGVVETRHGPLLDDRGFAIGDIRSAGSVQHFVPAFHNGVFVSYVSELTDQTVVSWYSPGIAGPQDTLTLPSGPGSDGVEPLASAGGLNQNLYVFVSGGLGTPEIFQVLDDGGLSFVSQFTWSGISEAVSAHAGLNHLGQERLWAVEAGGFNRALERYAVSGATITHLANGFLELPPEAFAESDRLLFVAAGRSIHTVDASNPLTPNVISTVTPGWIANYTKVLVHGRFLYALGGATGLDVFRINGNGSLTFRTSTGDASITDAAVVGRWLFTFSGSGLRAYDVSNVGAASPSMALLTTLAPGVTINAITARYDNSVAGAVGVNPVPHAVVYAVTSAAELRTYDFNGVALSLLGSASLSGGAGTGVTVKGDYAVAGTADGAYLFSVATPAAPFLTGPAIYPLAGPTLLQNGYLVGLGAAGDANGPAFVGRAAGGVDGAIRYSACSAPNGGQRGSLTHVDGRYAASCGRNGITLFTPVSVEGGRLLKSHDVTASWSTQGAALASDGMLARLAGPTIPGAGFTDASRLYTVNEQSLAEGTLAAPFYASTNLQANLPSQAAGSDVNRSASFLVESDGLVFAVTRKVLSAPTVDAFDPGSSPWTYLGRYTFAGTAEPAAVATDGEYLYVARNGNAGQVDVVDIRNPAAMTLRASTGALPVNHLIASLALSRDRLYAGMAQGLPELNEVRIWDVSAVQASASVSTKVTLQIGVEGGITGVAVVGRALFYTLHDPIYQVPQYLVGVHRLASADRDGGAGTGGDTGALGVARLTAQTPAQSPVVAGDVLYVASNLGTASYDLAPYWREGLPPTPVGGVNLADPFRTGPITLRIDGPFASSVGGVYRVFDLR